MHLRREASDVTLLRKAREQFDLRPLVIHVNYLVNLAALDPLIRAKSISAFRGELERAAVIGAEYLVVHPGSYRGQTLEQGIEAFVAGLKEASEGLAGSSVTVLIENTVGCGAQIGCRFEELNAIRERARSLVDLPVGYCLDTCHLLASGYNIAVEKGLAAKPSRKRSRLSD